MFFTLSSFAQFSFGVKAGVNMNKFVASTDELLDADMTYGPIAGLFFRLKFTSFSINPDILFSQKSGGFEFNSKDTTANYAFDDKASYIDVPVKFGFHFLKFFSVNTGPVFSFLISEDVNFKASNTSASATLNDDVFKSVVFGWQAGVSVEIKKIIISGGYEFSLSPLISDFVIPDTDITVVPDGRNSIYYVTFGYKFL